MLVLKRILKGTRSLPSGRKLLQVRDVLALGPKRAIYLIGLENRNLVVGSSGDELTLLSEYSTEQDDAAPARAMASREPAAATLPAAAAATGAVPARLDVEVGGEIAVPSEEAAATAPGAPAHPRAFSFAALQPNRTRAAKAAHPERVPHKFRQLLEQATGAEESAR